MAEHTTKENGTTDALKRIHRMVEKVKLDEEVSLKYMKILEREEMLIEQGQKIGQEIGRRMERENTERERKRADAEAKMRKETERELEYWKNLALGIG